MAGAGPEASIAVPDGSLGPQSRRRPQSSPILVENAHTAVGVAEVPIIMSAKSKPDIGSEMRHAQKDLKYELPVQPPKSRCRRYRKRLHKPPYPRQNRRPALRNWPCKINSLWLVNKEMRKQSRHYSKKARKICNAKGEQPLGAAVWGMCPDVVNALLKQAGGVASMTWNECEQHNLKHYKEVFIVSKFAPQTFGEWYQLLLKMDLNPFIQVFHLKKADEQWNDSDTSSWKNLKKWVKCINVSNNDDWIGEELMILRKRWRSVVEQRQGL